MTKRPILDDNPTPIPESPNELATVVARIDDRTRMMSEIYLPQVEKVATEARDGVILLTGRVNNLEEKPDHECDEKERQERQDHEIHKFGKVAVDTKYKVKGLSTFRNWLIAAIVLVVGSAGGFAIVSRSTEASHETSIEANRDDIDRHEKILYELPRKADFDRMEKAIKAVPATVVKLDGPPSIPEIRQELENLGSKQKIKQYELEAVRKILSRAEEE